MNNNLKETSILKENLNINTNQKPNKIKKKKKRCNYCNKKLPLIPINCKCGLNFCNSCRDPNIHNCTFDYKKNISNILQNCGGGTFNKFEKI